jgi:hypothetical protein
VIILYIAVTFLVVAFGVCVLAIVWPLCVMAKRQHQEMDKYEEEMNRWKTE